MAKKKAPKKDITAARDLATYTDEARNTSSSNRFSTYERWKNPDKWDGDLIIEHRGTPNLETEPPA